MIAPFIGANILEYADWRAIFWTLGLFGIVACLAAGLGAPESLAPALRGSLDFRLVVARYGELLRSRRFLGYALCSACVFAGMFAFLSGSSFVLIETYGLSPRVYSYCFAANVVAITGGASLNAWMVRRLGAERVLRVAVRLPAIAGAVLLVAGLVEHLTHALGIWPFVPLFVASIGGISVVAPNATSGALQNYPHMAGIASSLIGIVQYGLGAIFGVIVGQLVGGSILPMVAVMAIGGFGCLLAHRLLVRHGASPR
jgi:DHA1 family bicyclomycin/chloramphenicol resistance-like MFS transporter